MVPLAEHIVPREIFKDFSWEEHIDVEFPNPFKYEYRFFAPKVEPFQAAKFLHKNKILSDEDFKRIERIGEEKLCRCFAINSTFAPPIDDAPDSIMLRVVDQESLSKFRLICDEFVRCCVEQFYEQVNAEYQRRVSKEVVIETCKDRNILFSDDGKPWDSF